MAKNVKLEINNTGFVDIPCNETIHRDDNQIFHLCKYNIKDQFIGYSDVIFSPKDTYKLLYPDYTNPLNPYNIALSSETLSAITSITNRYLSDKRIYIPVSLEKPNYYYFVARGSGKSIKELCYVAKVMSNHSSHMLSTTYSSEYKAQNYKSDMENLYKDKIFHKALDYYLTNIHHNQRTIGASSGSVNGYMSAADKSKLDSITVSDIGTVGANSIKGTGYIKATIAKGVATLSHNTSGVTAGTYGADSTNNFTIPKIVVDSTGHITSASSYSVTANNIVSKLGTTAVNRATADSDGNAINSTYLKLSGGAMTGNISYQGTKATIEVIRFIDNKNDASKINNAL